MVNTLVTHVTASTNLGIPVAPAARGKKRIIGCCDAYTARIPLLRNRAMMNQRIGGDHSLRRETDATRAQRFVRKLANYHGKTMFYHRPGTHVAIGMMRATRRDAAKIPLRPSV